MNLTKENLHWYCTQDGDCLLWKLGTNKQGYPQAHLGGKGGQMVRRYVYTEIMGRTLNSGKRVSARCGNRLCCSPDHLFQETHSQTLKRCYQDGTRSAKLEYVRRLEAFLKHRPVKLSFEKAREIRSRPREVTHAELAREYGVTEHAIRRVRNGTSWKDNFAASSVFTYSGML